MASLRLGFVGAGKQAQAAHLRHYASFDGCTIAAIADLDAELARRVATRLSPASPPPTCTTHTELIRRHRPDAIVAILPPNPAAERVICDILDAGIPLLVEKPLAGSPAAGQRIAARAAATATPLTVAFHKRCDPATLAARGEIDRLKTTGELGKLTYARVHVALTGDWIANGYRDTLAGSREHRRERFPADEYPGLDADARKRWGIYASGYGHQLDWLRYLLDEPLAITHVEPTGVLLLVEAASGLPAVFEATPCQYTRWVEYAELFFERGRIRIDLPPPLAVNVPGRVSFFRQDDRQPTHTTPVLAYEDAMRQQAEQFLAHLAGQPTPLCDAAEALESLNLATEWIRRLSEAPAAVTSMP